MTTPSSFDCPDCARCFESGRALTQHRRFVHQGAELFGYRLVDDSEVGFDTGADEQNWSETGDDRDYEVEPTEPEISLANVVLLACALIGAVYLAGRWATPDPYSARVGTSPHPPWPQALATLGRR